MPERAAADRSTNLARLLEKADRLTKEYRGELDKVESAKRQAKLTSARAGRLRRSVGHARQQVGQLAATRYMATGVDPSLAVVLSGDPQEAIDQAVTADFISRSSGEWVQQMSYQLLAVQNAEQAAQKSLDELRRELESLESRRREVQKLIARYGRQTPLGPDRITPRMRIIRDAVVARFGNPFGVGCYRPGGGGEHPRGRACDHMMSSGGQMPAPEYKELGDQIAAWAQGNASEYGVMYIIWRQRIWDARNPGAGWRYMGNRGSVTANHYDHVHISVF